MNSKLKTKKTQKKYTQKNLDKKNLFYHIGNICIVLSLFGLLFTFVPLLRAYLLPPSPFNRDLLDTFIEIPKIQAVAPLLLDVDPKREEIYKKELEKGVAHAKGTKYPGEKGTVFLFAHSSGSPWEITRYNTIFLRLGELEVGDKIRVGHKDSIYEYKVFDKKIVWPDDVQYLNDISKNQLIIQTCYPIGTSLQRLLVFATPI